MQCGPLHRPRQDLEQPVHLLAEADLASRRDEGPAQLDAGLAVEPAWQVGHRPHPHPAPQAVGLRGTGNLDAPRPILRRHGAQSHGPSRVRETLVLGHPAGELDAARGVAEEPSHFPVVASVPSVAERPHGVRSADDNAIDQRLAPGWALSTGLKRHPAQAVARPLASFVDQVDRRHHRHAAAAQARHDRPPLELQPGPRDAVQPRFPRLPRGVAHPAQPGELGELEGEPFHAQFLALAPAPVGAGHRRSSAPWIVAWRPAAQTLRK